MSIVKQSLQISSVGVEDGGDYICNVETVGKPLDQVHTLDVLGKCLLVLVSLIQGHLELTLQQVVGSELLVN